VEHALAWSNEKPEWPVDQHTDDGQCGVEDAKDADHEHCPARRSTGDQQCQYRQPPDHVQRIVARIAGREWQAGEYEAQRIQQQQHAALEQQPRSDH